MKKQSFYTALITFFGAFLAGSIQFDFSIASYEMEAVLPYLNKYLPYLFGALSILILLRIYPPIVQLAWLFKMKESKDDANYTIVQNKKAHLWHLQIRTLKQAFWLFMAVFFFQSIPEARVVGFALVLIFIIEVVSALYVYLTKALYLRIESDRIIETNPQLRLFKFKNCQDITLEDQMIIFRNENINEYLDLELYPFEKRSEIVSKIKNLSHENEVYFKVNNSITREYR